MAQKTHYELLAVGAGATTEEIRRAYHKLAREHHPDHHRDPEKKKQAEVLFGAITEAFNVLTDEERRRQYDANLRQSASGETAAQRESKGYYRAGVTKLNQGDLDNAVRLLQAAIHLDATQGVFHAQLAQALTKQSKFGDATRAWEQAIKLEPYNPKYLRLAGSCYEKAGMNSRARRMYEAALKWDKDDTQAADGLRRVSGEKKAGFLSGLFKKA